MPDIILLLEIEYLCLEEVTHIKTVQKVIISLKKLEYLARNGVMSF